MVALTALTVLFYPSIKDSQDFNELLGDEDSIIRAFVGDLEDLTSEEGYLNSQIYFLMVPVLLLIFAICAGSGAVAGEEERGILDLLLSHPIRRSSVVLQKLAALMVLVFGLAVVLWITVVIVARAVYMDVSAVKIAEVTLSGALLGSLFGALGLAIGSATGRRGLTIGISGAVAVLSYFVNALRPVADAIDPTRFITPFYYYIDTDPLSNGLDPIHVTVLVVAIAVLSLVAVVTFERRDIAV